MKVKYVGDGEVIIPDLHLLFKHGDVADVPEDVAHSLVVSGPFEIVEVEE